PAGSSAAAPRTGARPWAPPTSGGAATTATRTVSSATTAAGLSASATTVAVSASSPPRWRRAATRARRTARGSPGPSRRTRCARSVACCTAGTSCAGAPCRSRASSTTATPRSCWTSPTSPPRECGDPGRRLSVPGLPRTLPAPPGHPGWWGPGSVGDRTPDPRVRTHNPEENPMTNQPEPTVQATRYTVNCLPENGIDSHVFEITVEYRGRGLWAVKRHSQCLAADGTWDWEMRPSEREDDWLAEHRFDLDTALKLAKEAAPKVTVNGFTVTDALRMAQQRDRKSVAELQI